MKDNIAKIRAALELLEWRVLESERKNQPIVATRRQLDEALAALAELEKAAADPVAWMWDDMLGISHTYVSPKRPTWPDAGASPEMAVAINVRPLYAAPPAPVAEIREPTPEECERICAAYFVDKTPASHVVPLGRAMFDSVRAVMWPKSEAK